MITLFGDTIQESIDTIKKYSTQACELNPRGYNVAFSGGKDSIALLHLVKQAGVPYFATYNVTGNDPPELVRFIRREYPEVKFIHPPKKFWQLVEEKGFFPMRNKRYCCEILKELPIGEPCVTLVGVRSQESKKRAKQSFMWDAKKRITIGCMQGHDNVTLRPIMHLLDVDIWSIISENNLPYPTDIYARQKRIGCVFCPFSSSEEKAFYLIKYPQYAVKINRLVKRLRDGGGGYRRYDKNYYIQTMEKIKL
ncbi:MAG: phosphoadenosine phosphosulfate reductase family protein [Bacteroidales bacterium]|jgi:phosphoadenosine phosphosulfate reductase|nr:phosphoadenosine phosphosulfate reductase family protein [Bacteroidales bacterium]